MAGYQSPYKGFNRVDFVESDALIQESINPPIRGSIGAESDKMKTLKRKYQSPYKGFNSKKNRSMELAEISINPPIRGSIDIHILSIEVYIIIVSIPL